MLYNDSPDAKRRQQPFSSHSRERTDNTHLAGTPRAYKTNSIVGNVVSHYYHSGAR